MKSQEKNTENSDQYLVEIIERALKDDPLLLPYFEDGSFKLVDKPEDDFLWFKPGISPKTKEFILERIQIALGDKPEESDEEERRKWERREAIKKRLEKDEELFPFVLAKALSFRNTADNFKIEMDPSVPDQEAKKLIKRIRQVLKQDFGIGPEEGDEQGPISIS